MTASSTSTTYAWRDIRTGVLFVFGLVLIGLFALVISKNTGVGKKHNTAHFFTPDTKGLVDGNPVSIAGKKIGRVASLEIIRLRDTTGVLVILDIESQYFALLKSDAKAMIKGLGILGDKYVDIAVGESSQELADGGEITVEFEHGMDDLATKALATTASVNQLLDVALSLATKIDRGEGSIGRLINSTELSDELDGPVANLRGLTGRLANGNGLMWKLMEDPEYASQFSSTMQNLNNTLATVSDMAESVSSGQGTLGKLLTDDALYDQLLSVSQRADSLLDNLDSRTAALDGFSANSAFYKNINRGIRSLDSLFLDMKRSPQRYIHFSVFK